MTPKILTVDDSKAVRMIVKKAFKPYDCSVVEASNGQEGLDLAEKEKPDLILLDVTMPIMDGVEMLSKLKENANLKNIPVVMLTAESGKEMVMKIAKLGVRDYIVKPFKEDALLEKVIRIIELHPNAAEEKKARDINDAVSIIIIEDKEAIIEQLSSALSSRLKATIKAMADGDEAYEYAKNNPVDAFIVSLSLPNEAAFAFYRLLRSTVKTNSVPVIGMALKTLQAEQAQAQTLGFSGIIHKPIDPSDAFQKVAKALKINLLGDCFKNETSALKITLPQGLDEASLKELEASANQHINNAVEAGLNKVIFDLNALETLSMETLKFLVACHNHCQILSIKAEFLAKEAIIQQSKQFEEASQWSFVEA